MNIIKIFWILVVIMTEQFPATNYIEFLHPGIDAAQRERQLQIHQKMSRMLVESYWRQIRESRDRLFDNQLEDYVDDLDED